MMDKENSYKLIFLFDTPALQSDISKFGFERLLDITENVLVYDLSLALNPQINRIVTAPRMKMEKLSAINVSTFGELKRIIVQNKNNAFFFPMFDDYYEVRIVYYLFSLYRINYGYINNLNPDIGDVSIPRIQFSRDKLNYEKLKKGIYNRIIRKLNKFSPAKLYFYANELSRDHYFWRCNCSKRRTKMIGVHSFDFDRYLSSSLFKYDGPYAVYLDVFLPYHPDFYKIKNTIDAKNHYENMNSIFDEIEQNRGCKVLVAAHPRSNYSDKLYSFNMNNIYYGKTAELVKGADFLIGTWSTTNLMAVMANKPLIIVCDKELSNTEYCRTMCEKHAKFYGSEIITSREDVRKINIKVNEDIFLKIRNDYISVDNATEPDLWVRILNQIDKVMQ